MEPNGNCPHQRWMFMRATIFEQLSTLQYMYQRSRLRSRLVYFQPLDIQ